jgi:hypothetical protein
MNLLIVSASQGLYAPGEDLNTHAASNYEGSLARLKNNYPLMASVLSARRRGSCWSARSVCR